MRHAAAVLLGLAGCASGGLRLMWSDRAVVDLDAFQQPAPIMSALDDQALTCWRTRAEVDHRGFFVMRMSRASYALRFCVLTRELAAVKAKGQPAELAVRIDLSGEEDLLHAVQKMAPGCSPPAGARMTAASVRSPESRATVAPESGGMRFEFDTAFGVFVEIITALEEEAVHLWEERRLVGTIVLTDPPLVTDRGRLRCSSR